MLPPGVYHEAIVEGRVLTCSAPQSRPELLLAEGNRVIRDHRLSRMMAEEGSRGWGSRTTGRVGCILRASGGVKAGSRETGTRLRFALS